MQIYFTSAGSATIKQQIEKYTKPTCLNIKTVAPLDKIFFCFKNDFLFIKNKKI